MLAAGESAPEGAGGAILSEGGRGGDRAAMFVPGSGEPLGLRSGETQGRPRPSLVRAAPGSDQLPQDLPGIPGGSPGTLLRSSPGPTARAEAGSSTPSSSAPHTRCPPEGSPLTPSPGCSRRAQTSPRSSALSPSPRPSCASTN